MKHNLLEALKEEMRIKQLQDTVAQLQYHNNPKYWDGQAFANNVDPVNLDKKKKASEWYYRDGENL